MIGASGSITHEVSSFLTVVVGADYSVSVSQSQFATPNSIINYKIPIVFSGGFNHTVSLSAQNLPSGVSVTFLPSNLVTSTADVTMKVETSSSVAVGAYSLNVITTDQTTGIARSPLSAGLNVANTTPATLVSPVPFTKLPQSTPLFVIQRLPSVTQYTLTIGSRPDGFDYLNTGSGGSSSKVDCPSSGILCDQYVLPSNITVDSKKPVFATVTSTLLNGSQAVQKVAFLGTGNPTNLTDCRPRNLPQRLGR